jgi:HTH-type transcriptional regulator, sugar sensing transcriptional regulator
MQITELAAKLQSLGLSDKEAKVYVAALFLGASPVQRIAEQADVNRATAYVILEQLCAMGLVSQSTEGKKTVFIAEGPAALERFLERQEQELQLKRSELKQLLPELEQSHRAPEQDAPVVRFYKGIEGSEAASEYLRKTVEPGAEIYSLSNTDQIEKLSPDTMKANPKRRLKKRISSKLLYSWSRGEIKSDPKLLREAQKVDRDVSAEVNMYPERASFITYKGKESVAVVIENKEIVGALRQLFELAWENRKNEASKNVSQN